MNNTGLKAILVKSAASGWDLIAEPAGKWLRGEERRQRSGQGMRGLRLLLRSPLQKSPHTARCITP